LRGNKSKLYVFYPTPVIEGKGRRETGGKGKKEGRMRGRRV
jgi:hypothetical protein